MEKSEFTTIRKKLAKTQKELSELLGTSLKAVSSYEQGWRNIPVHVERQLLFLLAQKNNTGKHICWDIRQCSEEVKQSCPAWRKAQNRHPAALVFPKKNPAEIGGVLRLELIFD